MGCCWCLNALAEDIRITPDSSLADAIRQAREIKRTGKATAVTIHLAPGIYQLYEPIRLRPEDSGLTIEGHNAIISGGRSIRSTMPLGSAKRRSTSRPISPTSTDAPSTSVNCG